MNLPKPIFDLAQQYFSCHACWHWLRTKDNKEGQDARNQCFPSPAMWPNGLVAQRQTGCGTDFLRFHRQMIRNFKWIVAKAPPCGYAYEPWVDFPDWLATILDKVLRSYRQKIASDLDQLVKDPSLDKLGQYIEGETSDFPYIHFTVHEKVHVYELGKQPESDMGFPKTAPCNVHFWGFHGWIDEYYARWQRNHGEAVDQTPLKPVDPESMCPQCMQADNSISPWLVQWQEYLESQSQRAS